MTYKYLIFDLDDTLFDFKGGEMAGLENVFMNHGFSSDLTQKAISIYVEINRGLWAAFEKGEIEKSEIHETRFDRVLSELGLSDDGLSFEKDYRQELNHNYRLLEGAESLLSDLQKAGYHLIAGTNGEAQTQHLRLEHTGLRPYFEQVYISDEIGVAKPNKAFFDIIFGENPAMSQTNTLMIGDGVASDMLGGQNAGLDTMWVNFKDLPTPPSIQPTYTVDSYAALREVLI